MIFLFLVIVTLCGGIALFRSCQGPAIWHVINEFHFIRPESKVNIFQRAVENIAIFNGAPYKNSMCSINGFGMLFDFSHDTPYFPGALWGERPSPFLIRWRREITGRIVRTPFETYGNADILGGSAAGVLDQQIYLRNRSGHLHSMLLDSEVGSQLSFGRFCGFSNQFSGRSPKLERVVSQSSGDAENVIGKKRDRIAYPFVCEDNPRRRAARRVVWTLGIIGSFFTIGFCYLRGLWGVISLVIGIGCFWLIAAGGAVWR